MKVTRKMLLTITASLGVLIIVYSLVRHFFDIGVSEGMEKYFFDTIIIVALGCFMYNRKLAKDERLAKEAAQAEQAAQEAERRAMEEGGKELEGQDAHSPSGEEQFPADEENLPHWERRKESGD